TEFGADSGLEAASACRREACVASGGYWAPFFIGHEGWDLALRLLDAGHELVYTPDVRVRHMVDPTVRPSSRIYYTFTRNAVWVALRTHRPAAALATIARDLALMGFASARAGQLAAFARGVVDASRDAGQALRTRRARSRETARRLRTIRALKPSIASRAWRHARERLI